MTDPEAVIAEFIAFADSGGQHAEPDDLERYVAGWLLEHLAAAGYTVTRDRYEVVPGMFDGCDRLYRKIEGSTDG